MPRSIFTIRMLGVVCALVLGATNAQAQIPDHLQCFKIKDAAAKTSYLAVLTPSDVTFPPAVGCTIKVPAKLLCVDAVKSSVTPVPPGAADGIAGQKYLCYKTKCPKNQPVATLTDQFGSHAIEVKSTGLVCAPIPPAFSCTDMIANGDETDVDCGGSCAGCTLGQDCLLDGDCASAFCSGNVCADSLSDGQPCSSGGECSSTQCVDGVCCNSGCTSLCQACTAARKGSGADGTCGSIAELTDPDNECAGADICNGSGACTSALSDGQICVSHDSCLSGYCVDTRCCNSACGSTCEACSAAKKGSGTDGSCGTIANGIDPDYECAGTDMCNGSGACTPMLPDGSSCMSHDSCLSGYCVDTVCCNSACGSTCEACSAARKGSGADGSCGTIANGTDPDNECAGVTTCDGAGMCTP